MADGECWLLVVENSKAFVRVHVRNAVLYQQKLSATAEVQHFLMLVAGQYEGPEEVSPNTVNLHGIVSGGPEEVSPNTVNLHGFVRVHVRNDVFYI